MKGAKALVTGGTGFLGGSLAYKLRDEGWEVAAVGRNAGTGKRLENDGIRFVQADLRDQDTVREACAGVDTVFHCAALSSPWGTYREFYGHNVEATRHVIDGCLQHGVRRLVNVSTPSIYCTNEDRFNIHELEPLPPKQVNAYAATKRLAEEAITAAHNRSDLETVSLRPRGIFGPGDTAILPRLIRANSRSGIPLFNGGRALLDLTYVDNAADALVLAAAAPTAAMGRAYNITNGEPSRFIDVLTKLFQLLDIPMRTLRLPFLFGKSLAAAMEGAARLRPGQPEPVMTRHTVSLLSISQTLDISSARELLDYSPKISMEEGLAIFAYWWRTTQ
ncbi:NAD-dependent epimerase/dehydratase family protein [Paenibacillaceae bacterium]|nr:NAD-dependent epimerase/dehydratase family protein [Paenibacillaceae bacterium]